MKIACIALVVIVVSSLPVSAVGGKQHGRDAQEFHGILLSKTCFDSYPNWIPYTNEHGIDCAMMPECYLAAYYLVIDERTVYRLDRKGELLARRVMQKTRRLNNFLVVIRGRLARWADTPADRRMRLYVQTMEEEPPPRP